MDVKLNSNEIQKWGAISRYRAAALSHDVWLVQLSGWGVLNPMPSRLLFQSRRVLPCN